MKFLFIIVLFFSNGIYAESKKIKDLKFLAKQNDTKSQYQLAIMYELGLGVERDLELAAYWYKQAKKNNQKIKTLDH